MARGARFEWDRAGYTECDNSPGVQAACAQKAREIMATAAALAGPDAQFGCMVATGTKVPTRRWFVRAANGAAVGACKRERVLNRAAWRAGRSGNG